MGKGVKKKLMEEASAEGGKELGLTVALLEVELEKEDGREKLLFPNMDEVEGWLGFMLGGGGGREIPEAESIRAER